MAQRGTCPQLPLLSAAVAGRQAAAWSLVKRHGAPGPERMAQRALALPGLCALHFARRRWTGAVPRFLGTWHRRPNTAMASTAVEQHLTRLPGTRQVEELETGSLSPTVSELVLSFRLAPQGLVAALADVLGLPPEPKAVAMALGEDPEAVLTRKAQQRAQAGLHETWPGSLNDTEAANVL